MYEKRLLQPAYVILLVFVLVAFIRGPQTNRPLSFHHEFCTSVALRVMDIWWEKGIAQAHFSPIMNYPGEQNKFINNHATSSMKMVDKNGSYYYISHPPFGYYLPYSVFRILYIRPTVFGIQFFQWLIHLACGLFMLLIAQMIVRKYAIKHGIQFSFAVFFAYMFNPSTLWFQGNVYMSDTLVIFFVIAAAYCWFLFLHEKPKIKTWQMYAVFFVISFFGGFTSWYAFIFAISLCLMAFFYKQKRATHLALLSLAGVSVSLLLTITIYSGVNGFDAVFAELNQRYGQRGFSAVSLEQTYNRLQLWTFNYAVNYLPYLIFFIAGSIFLLIKKQLRFSGSHWKTAGIFLLPVVLVHLILPNYVGHDFTTLYAAPLISLACGFVWLKIYKNSENRQGIYIVGFLVLLAGVFLFNLVNRPGDESIQGKSYAQFLNAANYITKYSSSDDVVFLKGKNAEPQLVYYAGRNIQQVSSRTEAEQILAARYPGLSGVVFKADSAFNMKGFLEIEAQR